MIFWIYELEVVKLESRKYNQFFVYGIINIFMNELSSSFNSWVIVSILFHTDRQKNHALKWFLSTFQTFLNKKSKIK